MSEPVRWGVLGPGMIAVMRTMPAMAASSVATLAALASRNSERATRIAADWPGCRAYGDYAALLRDDAIEAVYVALPNHLHLEWTVKALEAGKHVLCEKPLGVAPADIRCIIAARDRSGRHVEEAFGYRNHPQWQAVADLVASGRIGTVVGAQSTIAKRFLDPADIRNDPHGGGALLDLGSYSISGFNLLFGRPPRRVLGVIDRDPAFGIDRLTSAVLDYGGAHAMLQVGTQAGTDGWGTHQHLSVLASKGWCRLDFPYAQARPVECHLFIGNASSVGNLASETHRFAAANQYQLQVDRFSRCVRGEKVPSWPIEDALQTAEISAAIMASADEGNWVEL
jgi:predicted dehydrogenase